MSQNNSQNNPFADAFKTFESFGKQNSCADFENAISTSQKTFQTFQQAGNLMAESFGSIVKIQSEIAQENAQNAINLFKEVASSKDPQESAAKQADFAKSAFEKASKNAQQIADIASKANNKATQLINKQVSENIAQCNQSTPAAKKPANKAA